MHPEQLHSVLQRFMDAAMEDVHTVTVGRIEEYDGHDTRRATVLPLVRVWLSTGEVVPHKPITDVPVVFPSTASAGVILPVKRGDLVLLGFAEQGIGGFLQSKTKDPVDADGPSKFAFHDCIAIPGVFPFAQAPKISVPDGAVGVLCGKTSIILEDSKFTVTDGSGNKIESSSSKITVNGHLEVLK